MAKYVSIRTDWLKAEHVADIYSISSHVSKDFADYMNFWKHNGYWLFDSPQAILEVAKENSLDLVNTRLFYYEIHELEYDEDDHSWKPFAAVPSLKTHVVEPGTKHLEGYDIVTFSCRTSPECSPLSCNSLAAEVETNEHCLLPSFEKATQLLADGRFKNSEPGPYRVFAVYSVQWP